MPLYEFKCVNCGDVFERRLHMAERHEVQICPKCSGNSNLMVSANSRQSDQWAECTRDNHRNTEATKKLFSKTQR